MNRERVWEQFFYSHSNATHHMDFNHFIYNPLNKSRISWENRHSWEYSQDLCLSNNVTKQFFMFRISDEEDEMEASLNLIRV